MPEYDKLVRDRIPKIIAASGRTAKTHIVEGEEFFRYLDKKLDEEVSEFHSDRNLEELADVLEVVIGLASNLGYSEEELFALRNKKKEERGAFFEGIILERTE